MAVHQRKGSGKWIYDFVLKGKRYSKVCMGCTTQRDAEAFERMVRKTVEKAVAQETPQALVDNFRRELSKGKAISLEEAYDLSLKKPRKRTPSDEGIATKRSYWKDFVTFMEAQYPEIKTLDDVTISHAEEYIQQLRTHGRFNRTISYKKNGRCKQGYQQAETLSNKTINTYQQALAEVFTLLAIDAGIIRNPFAGIPMLKKESETREPFTEAELQTIRDKADPFILDLFTVACATALREGDICTLKWKEVDLASGVIRRTMNKTGHLVEIPILAPLAEYLQLVKGRPMNDPAYAEFVFPVHAKMYQGNPSGISYRIKQFLEKECHITTTKVPKGRTRAVSVKDLHSCRHTFCYYAGVYGIPLTVVQSIVGHMSPEMTKLYSAHATIEDKKRMMEKLPSFLISGKSQAKMLPVTDDVAGAVTADAEKQSTLDAIVQILTPWAVEDLKGLRNYLEAMGEPPDKTQGKLF